VTRLLVASPRGYCAGVERAVDTVEQALRTHGSPIYVRKQIVHNRHVVSELEERGAIFVDSVADVPAGAIVVFSAHGVAPAVRDAALNRGLSTIDATCPLVHKVHAEVRRYASAGYTIVLVGHAGHEEVAGTAGEAPGSVVLVQSAADAEQVALPPGRPVAYVTQTTLSVDDTREVVAILRRRFPGIVGPAREDICYATTNRQQAVKELLPLIDLLLVVGSRNSSNSNRLVEVALRADIEGRLIEDETEIDEAWIDRYDSIGLTAGASTPEFIVGRVCDWFRAHGITDVCETDAEREDVSFRPPVELRDGHRARPSGRQRPVLR
jgi:4-hydroxy-3-methylbut-2-en-1-yl diphosphate reductase